MKERRYWEEKREKKCRFCEKEGETWEHMWTGCRRWQGIEGCWEEICKWVLVEEGQESCE